MKVHPYLNFAGTTEEAFNFYKSIFGGEFPVIFRYRDMEGSHDMPAPDGDKIMHMALPLGDGTMLMGTDLLESMDQKLTRGNDFSLSISVDTNEEADKLHAALAAGGNVTVPMAIQSWGDYFGMATDKFGVSWMVSVAAKRD